AVPLPLFLYNMPSHTKLNFEPDTVARALQIPNVVGLKDSSGQMVYFHKVRELVAARPDFALLMGPEELLADAVLFAGHGGASGGAAHRGAGLYVALSAAALRGALDRVRQLQGRVLQIATTIYAAGPYWSAFVKGLKCALSCLGLCGDFVAEPFQRFGAAER